MVLTQEDMGGGTTTKLLKVDLDAGVATYLVEVPSYVTRYIVTSMISHMVITKLRSIITELVKSYYLPDGKLYTVVKTPTRIEVGEPQEITRLLGVDVQVVTLNHPPKRVQPQPVSSGGWSEAVTKKIEAGMI